MGTDDTRGEFITSDSAHQHLYRGRGKKFLVPLVRVEFRSLGLGPGGGGGHLNVT